LTLAAPYVLFLFMSAEDPATELAAPSGPLNQRDNRHAPLLGLVCRIIDFGRDLLATLERQNTPVPSTLIAGRFGTFNLALIIARITRGLRLAAGLESRLRRARPAPTAPRAIVSRPAAPTRPRPARRPVPSQAEDDAALLRGVPSAQEIAAHIRNRSAGAVIVEICRDLGIDTTHPLWPNIRDAIIAYDGSLARMLKLWMGRASAFLAGVALGGEAAPAEPWHAWSRPLAAGTGPP
jgi:hypothetical protein